MGEQIQRNNMINLLSSLYQHSIFVLFILIFSSCAGHRNSGYKTISENAVIFEKDIIVSEIGLADPELPVSQQKILAEQAAVIRCHRSLARYIHGSLVSGKTSVKDAVFNDEYIQEKINGIVKGAEIVNKNFVGYNECHLTMKISIDILNKIQAGLSEK